MRDRTRGIAEQLLQAGGDDADGGDDEARGADGHVRHGAAEGGGCMWLNIKQSLKVEAYLACGGRGKPSLRW